MASPSQIPTAAGSDSPPTIHKVGKENVDIVSDCPTLHREGAVSTKRRKKPGGFNLRKSIAWNPAFFTEEGVLDNSELSMLSGSQLKPNRSPGSGVGASTIPPLCRFGRSGGTSVLKEITENSRGPAKHRSAENKGTKLFSPAKTSERDERRELAGTQDRRSARSIQKCIPRPTAGHAPKKVPNSSTTAQTLRTPRKSQPSIPMVPKSTTSATNISKIKKPLLPARAEHTHRAEGLSLKSKMKSASLTKSSGPNMEKDAAHAVTTIHEEAKGSGKCKSFSHNKPSGSAGVPASSSAKPSALRMPSPSVGFFAQEKASLSHGDTAQRNAKKCFTGNASSHVKPPRYKQPEDLKSRLHLAKQVLTNCSAASKLLVQPATVTSESTLTTLAFSIPGIEHASVCSAKESLSKGIATYSAKSGHSKNQELLKVDSVSAGGRATAQPLSSEDNDGSRSGVPNAYTDSSHVEESVTIHKVEPIEDPYFLKAVSSPTIEPVEDSFCHEAICATNKSVVVSKLSSSCISSQVYTLDDLNCQRKSDNCGAAPTDVGNSLSGETTVALPLPEGNNCIPGLDLRDFDSCDQRNAECSTLMESVESTICAYLVTQYGSSIDIKPALANSTSDLKGSLCNEGQSTSAEEPHADGRMLVDSDNSLSVKEDHLLHVECEFDHDSGSTECFPMQQAADIPCMVRATQAADLSDLNAVTIDSKKESHDSLTVDRRPVLSEEPNTEDNMELDEDELSAPEDATPTVNNKAAEKSGTNTIIKTHLKNLVPFSEEWLAAMEACGEEVLQQKSGAVQNSPTDKTTPEPSPWSPVKRKAQDVGPFDCTKYSKSVRTTDTP